MNKISKVLVLLGAVAPIAAFSVTPDQPASTNSTDKLQALFADSVVVKGKGIEIKRNELDSEVVNTRAQMAARSMPAAPDQELAQQALKSLVIKQLVLNKSTDADRAEGKKDFDDRVAKLKASSGLTDEEFDKRISSQFFGGQTRAQWDKQNIEMLTVPVVLEREMGVKITDDDAKKFYDDPANISDFEQPEMVRASHILLMTSDPATQRPLSDEQKAAKHKQLEDILKQAKDGKDFAELAKQYSEDPGSKNTGGEYTFPRGRMDKTFEDTAFSLKPGEISGIIETRFGYHIIKLSEKIPAKKVDFDKVKDEIKDHLKQVAISKQLHDYMAKLEKDANLEILDDSLKGTDLLPAVPPAAPGAGATAPPQAQK